MSLKQHRRFTREFKLQVLAEITAENLSPKRPANINCIRHSLVGGRNSSANMLIAPSRATVVLILTKLASPSLNAWSVASLWRTNC